MDFYKIALAAWTQQEHPRDAERLAERLLAAGERQRQILLANDRRLASVEVCRVLLQRCDDLRRVDIIHYMAAASAAVATAEAIAGPPEALRSDLRAEAWGEWGNALRARGDLRAARSALEVAREAVTCGTGDPLVEGQILAFSASFAREVGNLHEAVEWGLESVAIFDEIGEGLLAARSQVAVAIAYAGFSNWLSALRHLERAFQRSALHDDLGLATLAAHNVAAFLSEGGYPHLALKVAARVEKLYRSVSDGPDLRARSFVIRAEAHLQLGEPTVAASLYRRASEAFLILGRLNDAALATLEAAGALLRSGDYLAVGELADRAAAELLRLGSASGALAAITVLKTAVEASNVSAQLLADLKQRVESERRGASDPLAAG